MKPRLVDFAWHLIVEASFTDEPASLRIFRMSRSTLASLQHQRDKPFIQSIYGIPVLIDDTLAYGHITLEVRR